MGLAHLPLLCGLGLSLLADRLLRGRRPAFTPPGLQLDETDAPALFAAVRRIADQLGTAPPARVYLYADVNAFVADVPGLGRVLGLGAGLFSLERAPAVCATLAHELGHLEAGDLWLGGFLYRARAALLGRAPAGQPRGALTTWLLERSRATAQARELAADRAAARVAGRAALIESLRVEHTGRALFDRFLVEEVAPLVAEGFRPEDLFEGFRAYLTASRASGASAALEEALLAAPGPPDDSHPPLSARLAHAEGLELLGPPPIEPLPAARSLLERPEELERAVTEAMFSRADQPPLLPIAWSEVEARVHAPAAAREAARLRAGLAAPGPAEAALKLLENLERGRLGALMTELCGATDASQAAEAALVSLYTAAALRDGAERVRKVGRPLELRWGARAVSPAERVRDALSRPSARRQFCRELGKLTIESRENSAPRRSASAGLSEGAQRAR